MEKKIMAKTMDFEKIGDQLSISIGPFFREEPCDLVKLIKELIQLERTIIDKRGKNKNYLEKDVLFYIHSVYNRFIDDYEFDYELLEESLIENTKNKDLKQAHKVSLEILNLVKFIFDFKLEKDNFSNLRKGLAITLLTCLLFEYEIDGEFDYYRIALRSGNSQLVYDTLEELKLLQRVTEREIPNDLLN